MLKSTNKFSIYTATRDFYRKIKLALACAYNSCTDYQPKLLILTYHRILPERGFDPFCSIITLKTFIRQIEILAKKYPIISLHDAINQCQSGKPKEKVQVVLNFDDGYCDNYEIVFPILKQKGLPATFFIVPDYVGSDRPLWDCELVEMLYNNKDIGRIKIGNEIICHKVMQPRLFFISSVIDKMKSLSFKARGEILDSLKNQTQRKFEVDYAGNRCITWEQAKEMCANGMEIGSHGLSHSSLSRIPFSEAMQETRRSKELIENKLNSNCLHFAFPFGSKKDYNQNLIDYVKNIGFKTCLLNIYGYNHIKKDAFCFKRIIIEESSDLRFLLC